MKVDHATSCPLFSQIRANGFLFFCGLHVSLCCTTLRSAIVKVDSKTMIKTTDDASRNLGVRVGQQLFFTRGDVNSYGDRYGPRANIWTALVQSKQARYITIPNASPQRRGYLPASWHHALCATTHAKEPHIGATQATQQPNLLGAARPETDN